MSAIDVPDEDTQHAAYLAAIAKSEPMQAMIAKTETHTLPDGATSEQTVGAGTAEASPLSLRESHARLILSASKLGESVKAAKARSDEALTLYRKLRDELDETSRALKALDRIAHPQKRTK